MVDQPIDTTDQQAVTVAQEDAVVVALREINEMAWGIGDIFPNDATAVVAIRQTASEALDALDARLASVSSASAETRALDWRMIAKAAGEHGVRYRTNASMAKFLAAVASPEPVPETNQAGEVEPVDDDDALEAVADCFNGSEIYGRTEAWAEGKTLSILFKETGQIAKLRFVKLVDKPSNADLRGEPA